MWILCEMVLSEEQYSHTVTPTLCQSLTLRKVYLSLYLGNKELLCSVSA